MGIFPSSVSGGNLISSVLKVGPFLWKTGRIPNSCNANFFGLGGNGDIIERLDRRKAMPKGSVKWFNPQKGYGFIQPRGGGGKDVFVHISAVERAGLTSLNEGQAVEYDIVESRGKSSAENLKVAR
jgi:CspA family cold shock protein